MPPLACPLTLVFDMKLSHNFKTGAHFREHSTLLSSQRSNLCNIWHPFESFPCGKKWNISFFLHFEGIQWPQLTHIKWMSFALQSSSRYVSFCPGCGQIGNIAARRRITAARPNPPNRGGWSKELPQYRALMATILYWSSGPLSGHLLHELQYTNNLQ